MKIVATEPQTIQKASQVEGVLGGPLMRRAEEEFLVPQGAFESSASPPHSFSDILTQSLNQVNQDQQDANVAIKELVAGRTKNIHETMVVLERADTSLKLMMQVRNKILDAYKEVMRMQV